MVRNVTDLHSLGFHRALNRLRSNLQATVLKIQHKANISYTSKLLTWVISPGFPAHSKLNQVEIPSIRFDNLYKLLFWFPQQPGGAVRSSWEPQLFLFDAGSFNMQCNFKKYMSENVKRLACAELSCVRTGKNKSGRSNILDCIWISNPV